MGFADVVVMVLIIAGACSLLYRSVWKKQGHCTGCDAGACGARNPKTADRCP
jgi:hypothetical protein